MAQTQIAAPQRYHAPLSTFLSKPIRRAPLASFNNPPTPAAPIPPIATMPRPPVPAVLRKQALSGPSTRRLPLRYSFRRDFDKRPPPPREQLKPPNAAELGEKSAFLQIKSGNTWKPVRLVLKGSFLKILRNQRDAKAMPIADIFRVSTADEGPGQAAFRITAIQGSPVFTFLCGNEKEAMSWIASIKLAMRAERLVPESVIEGNFKKKSHNKKFNKWDGRWFILSSPPGGGPSSAQLFYYRSRQDEAEAEKKINVADIVHVGHIEEDGEPYCLEVQTVARTWVLSAADLEDLTDWLLALHTLMRAIKEVYVWGDNTHGQLGVTLPPDGSAGGKRTLFPVMMNSLRGVDVAQVACGLAHTLVLLDDGRVFSWGANTHGQLGHGDDIARLEPCIIDALDDTILRQVVCAENTSHAVTEDGRVFSWGDTQRWRPPNSPLEWLPRAIAALEGMCVRQVAASAFHVAAVTDTGIVYTWGENSYGQLGHGDHEPRQQPTRVNMPDGSGGGEPWQVACGCWHTCVVLEHGTVYTWGDSSFGQLGHGDKTARSRPTLVDALHGNPIQMLSCGMMHTLAVSVTGELYAWGKGENGQLGLGPKAFGQKAPGKVQGLPKPVTGVACGATHSAVTLSNGDLYTWGKGPCVGGGDDKDVSNPVFIAPLAGKVGRVFCGTTHTVAICARHQWSSLYEDSETSKCATKDCGAPLTECQRPHQCRRCLRTFCFLCAATQHVLPGMCYTHDVRVCDECFRFAEEWCEPDEDNDATEEDNDMHNIATDTEPESPPHVLERKSSAHKELLTRMSHAPQALSTQQIEAAVRYFADEVRKSSRRVDVDALIASFTSSVDSSLRANDETTKTMLADAVYIETPKADDEMFPLEEPVFDTANDAPVEELQQQVTAEPVADIAKQRAPRRSIDHPLPPQRSGSLRDLSEFHEPQRMSPPPTLPAAIESMLMDNDGAAFSLPPPPTTFTPRLFTGEEGEEVGGELQLAMQQRTESIMDDELHTQTMPSSSLTPDIESDAVLVDGGGLADTSASNTSPPPVKTTLSNESGSSSSSEEEEDDDDEESDDEEESPATPFKRIHAGVPLPPGGPPPPPSSAKKVENSEDSSEDSDDN